MSFVVHRVSKSAARYTDAGGREKCGYCRFFVAPRACGKVIGPVSPAGWCKYFSRQMVSQYSGAGSTPIGRWGHPSRHDARSQFHVNGQHARSGVTFTRASTAALYLDSIRRDPDGGGQSAALGLRSGDACVARCADRGSADEHSVSVCSRWSGDQSNAAWVPCKPLGGVRSRRPLCTANNTTAPNGALAASDTTNGIRDFNNSGNASVASSQLYVQSGLSEVFTAITAPHGQIFSVWLRGNAGGEQTYIHLVTLIGTCWHLSTPVHASRCFHYNAVATVHRGVFGPSHSR